MNKSDDDITELGRGAYWQDLHVGQRFRTLRRTITETDLINFISTTGMLEAIFIDAEFEGAAIDGRPVPAALTQCMIEGLLFQTMIQGTGLALLEMTLKALKPVRIGDTVWAIVTVTGIKPTSKNNRAVIDSEIAVYNTRDEQVLSYTAKRMLAGRS